jgi:2-dehydro-3-deoxy-D-arabinonate dehydratase
MGSRFTFPTFRAHFDAMHPISVYRCSSGLVAQRDGAWLSLAETTLDTLFQQPDPAAWLEQMLQHAAPCLPPAEVLAPIQNQEVWAAGVTYLRSRDARIEESKDAGGGTFYDRVYDADRPEIFFKATPHRVFGPGAALRLRKDSKWNVPEPELTLAINVDGKIFGYTIGNDLSSRDIEGENPLYLPQAKVWSHCCGLGPALVVCPPLPPETAITLTILRAGATVFEGATALTQMKRTPLELADWLWRDNSFPTGCYLLTGTGLVPPNEFTLASGDEVRISIGSLGCLVNHIA